MRDVGTHEAGPGPGRQGCCCALGVACGAVCGAACGARAPLLHHVGGRGGRSSDAGRRAGRPALLCDAAECVQLGAQLPNLALRLLQEQRHHGGVAAGRARRAERMLRVRRGLQLLLQPMRGRTRWAAAGQHASAGPVPCAVRRWQWRRGAATASGVARAGASGAACTAPRPGTSSGRISMGKSTGVLNTLCRAVYRAQLPKWISFAQVWSRTARFITACASGCR